MRLLALVTINAMLLLTLTSTVSAAEYNVEQFLELVEQHSKDLKLARQEVEGARAEKSEAKSLAFPHVNVQADYARSLKDTYMYIDMGDDNGLSKLKMNRKNNFGMGVSLRQTLFSGQVFNAIKAAGQYEDLTDLIYESTWQEIMTVSRQLFYQTLLLGVVVEVSQDAEQNALENYEDIHSAFDHGLVSEFELLQAEVRYRESIPQTSSAQRNYEIALVNLKNLAGIDINDDFTLNGTLDQYPQLPSSISADSALKNRPDFQAIVSEEQLRRTGVSAEKAAYWPSLGGFLSYDYSAQSDEFSLDEENNSVTAGLSLSIPIFQGGETRAKVKKAQIELEKVRIRRERAKLDIARDLRNAELSLEEAHRRISAAQATLKTAEKAFSIAEATIRSGLITQLQLKDARVALDQATTAYYQAIFEYLAAYFDWERISGSMNDFEIN